MMQKSKCLKTGKMLAKSTCKQISSVSLFVNLLNYYDIFLIRVSAPRRPAKNLNIHNIFGIFEI
jgi:hypothetical protein